MYRDLTCSVHTVNNLNRFVIIKHMYVVVSEDHMLDSHSCQICYPLEIKLLHVLLLVYYPAKPYSMLRYSTIRNLFFPLYISIILFTKTLLKARTQYIKSELKAAQHCTPRTAKPRTAPHHTAPRPSLPYCTASHRTAHAVPRTVPYPTLPCHTLTTIPYSTLP